MANTAQWLAHHKDLVFNRRANPNGTTNGELVTRDEKPFKHLASMVTMDSVLCSQRI
jgi:hypothetical protein